MPRTLATRLFDRLAMQRAARSAPQTLDPKQYPTTTGRNLGMLPFLCSFAVVATAIIVVFFGFSFLLLSHPKEQLIAGSGTGDLGVEFQPPRADSVSLLDKDATPFTAQAGLPNPATVPSRTLASSPEARQILPPAGGDTAWASLSATTAGATAASEAFDVSSRRRARDLRSNADEVAPAKSPGIAHATRTGNGRHPRNAVRKHWAGVSRPGSRNLPPPSLSPPEKAWRWIVHSTTGVLAALSPPPLTPPRR